MEKRDVYLSEWLLAHHACLEQAVNKMKTENVQSLCKEKETARGIAE